jgi:hypothetical protein
MLNNADNDTVAYTNKTRFHSNTDGGTASGHMSGLEVYQGTANEDAFMSFHVQGDYAGYFGIDGTTNDLFYGGWSNGAVKNKVWHAGNDGSGSGLDADTVDGVHESTFMRRTANSTLDMVNNNITNVNHLTFNDSGANEGLQWLGGSDWRIFESPDSLTNAAGNLQFTTGGTRRMTLSTGGSAWTSSQGTLWGASNDGSGSGLDADTVDGIQASSFLRSDATDYINGVLYSRADIRNEDAYRDHGVYGHYSSSKTNHIWSMGSAYRSSASGTNFGTLYGFGYKHTNNTTGGTMAGSHQAVWCHAGTPKCALGTNIWTSGNVTAYSDIRVKTNIEHIPNALDKVCQLNGYTFDRTDVTFDEHGEPETPIRQTGVIAQEVLKVLPEAVMGDEDGHYSVAYGNMVGLLIEAVKELKAEVEELKGNA